MSGVCRTTAARTTVSYTLDALVAATGAWSAVPSSAAPLAGPRSVVAPSVSGLMGIVVDPAFATNRQYCTCQAYRGTGTSPIDIRVIRWSLASGATTATRVGNPLISGLPISTGRHGGCRVRFDTTGHLHVGTGDAAVGTNPQDLDSLGGKTLRLNPDGTAPSDNRSSRGAGGPPTSGPTGTGTSRVSPCGRGRRRCGTSSTVPPATTRSTC